MSGVIGIRTGNKSGVLGGVYERGSSANGEYVKFEDGTLICTIKDLTMNSVAIVTWTYPIAFASGTIPTFGGTGGDADWGSRIATRATNTHTNTSQGIVAYTLSVGSSARTGTPHNLSAIGRWY